MIFDGSFGLDIFKFKSIESEKEMDEYHAHLPVAVGVPY
jgi:hypothetical protein